MHACRWGGEAVCGAAKCSSRHWEAQEQQTQTGWEVFHYRSIINPAHQPQVPNSTALSSESTARRFGTLRIVWLQLEGHAAAALAASLVAGARSRPDQLGSGIAAQGEALQAVGWQVTAQPACYFAALAWHHW